jgi:hypothetical protein
MSAEQRATTYASRWDDLAGEAKSKRRQLLLLLLLEVDETKGRCVLRRRQGSVCDPWKRLRVEVGPDVLPPPGREGVWPCEEWIGRGGTWEV